MKIPRTLPLCYLLALTACEEAPSIENQPKTKNTPMLIGLAERGDLPALDALLSKGSPPDVFDSCRWTPLMKAALKGHCATARRLLDAGANANAQDKGGYTALMLAASNGHSELTTLLLEYGANADLQELSLGWTALIWAAKEGHAPSVRALLDYGANTDLRDFDGRNATDWANANGHDAVWSLLVSHPYPPTKY